MYHLKLTKALSYTGSNIKADIKHPDVYTEDKAVADRAVASGYFRLVSAAEAEAPDPETPEQGQEPEPEYKTLNEMNTSELETYATYKDISLKGLKKKADMIAKITETLGIDADTAITDFGSPTMVELQEK